VDNIENMSDDEYQRAKQRAQKRKWRDANRESVSSYSREWAFKRRYGVTVAQYEDLKSAQEYRCAICGEHENDLPRQKTRKTVEGTQNLASALVVDHCHESGRVRKLLCFACNQAIGLMKESPRILESALRYLQEEC
jgi:hypothetical protein